MEFVAGTAPIRRLRKAAFLDRDGVINRDKAYGYKVEDFEFISGAVDALLRLRSAGYLLVIATNQSGIARGLFSEQDYQHLTTYMTGLLGASGVAIDSIEYCPHLPDAAVEQYRLACDCRKPQPGMLRRAIARLGIDAASSLLIGDRASDIEAGRRAGVGRCYIVRSGHPLEPAAMASADGVFDDIDQCVRSLDLSVTQ